jgi:hypothetical protein
MLCPVRFAIIACAALVAVAAPAQDQLLTNPGLRGVRRRRCPRPAGAATAAACRRAVIEPADEARSGERALRMLDTGPEVRDNTYADRPHRRRSRSSPDRDSTCSPCHARAIARNHDARRVNLQLRFLPVEYSCSNMAVNAGRSAATGSATRSGSTAPEDTTTRGASTSSPRTTGRPSRSSTTPRLQVVRSRDLGATRFPLAAHELDGSR